MIKVFYKEADFLIGLNRKVQAFLLNGKVIRSKPEIWTFPEWGGGWNGLGRLGFLNGQGLVANMVLAMDVSQIGISG